MPEKIATRAEAIAELRAVLTSVEAEVLVLEERRNKLLKLVDAYGLVVGHQEEMAAIEAAFLEFMDEKGVTYPVRQPEPAPQDEAPAEAESNMQKMHIAPESSLEDSAQNFEGLGASSEDLGQRPPLPPAAEPAVMSADAVSYAMDYVRDRGEEGVSIHTLFSVLRRNGLLDGFPNNWTNGKRIVWDTIGNLPAIAKGAGLTLYWDAPARPTEPAPTPAPPADDQRHVITQLDNDGRIVGTHQHIVRPVYTFPVREDGKVAWRCECGFEQLKDGLVPLAPMRAGRGEEED